MTIKDTILFFAIPVLFFALQIILEITLSDDLLSILHSENLYHELLEFGVIAVAFLVALRVLSLKPWRISSWLGAWMGVAAVSCLYVAGEEISWGQHILDWDTPEYWKDVNDQEETNLHNTSSWLDQKPRLLLEVGVLVGGLIIPFLKRFTPRYLPDQFSLIYPDYRFIGIAACAVLVKIFDAFFVRGSEVLELYMFYFVLMYLIVMYQRIAKYDAVG